MRHQLRPTIDSLESKALLSGVGTGLMAHSAVLQFEAQQVEKAPMITVKLTPREHLVLDQIQRLVTSGMTVTLTTDRPAYNPGQVVHITLTMTNTSNHEEIVGIGPSIDGFSITHNNVVIWRSNAGPQPTYIQRRAVKPGQSIVLTASWTATNLTGTFVVANQLAPAGPTATFTVSKPT